MIITKYSNIKIIFREVAESRYVSRRAGGQLSWYESVRCTLSKSLKSDIWIIILKGHILLFPHSFEYTSHKIAYIPR
jgi:hypothetical protein